MVDTPKLSQTASYVDMMPAKSFGEEVNKSLRTHDLAMRKLVIVSIVSVFFITAQLVGGYLAHSIAIFTDSAHLASDMVGFAISMTALTLGQRGSTHDYTFGWHRAEVVGTMISISVIWIMTIWLLAEATKRFFQPPKVQGGIMLIVAVLGIFFNLIQMKILHSGDGHYHLGGDHDHDHEHGHEHNHDHEHSHGHSHAINDEKEKDLNAPLLDDGADSEEIEAADNFINTGNMNIDAAFLHVMGDMLMSFGVTIAAFFIYLNPNLWWFDPLCTYLFSVIVMFTTMPIIKNCIQIMMEGTPKGISMKKLRNKIMSLDSENIVDVHDIHVWQIAASKNTMSAHITSKKPLKTLAQVTDLVRRPPYNLHHTTIQVEGVDNESNPHYFECGNDLHD